MRAPWGFPWGAGPAIRYVSERVLRRSPDGARLACRWPLPDPRWPAVTGPGGRNEALPGATPGARAGAPGMGSNVKRRQVPASPGNGWRATRGTHRQRLEGGRAHSRPLAGLWRVLAAALPLRPCPEHQARSWGLCAPPPGVGVGGRWLVCRSATPPGAGIRHGGQEAPCLPLWLALDEGAPGPLPRDRPVFGWRIAADEDRPRECGSRPPPPGVPLCRPSRAGPVGKTGNPLPPTPLQRLRLDEERAPVGLSDASAGHQDRRRPPEWAGIWPRWRLSGALKAARVDRLSGPARCSVRRWRCPRAC